ncbi:MAG: efflux RND transporter periplasmic adaptor subunit [Isosphaeraceae bacterium]
MTTTQWWKAATVLLVAGATASAVERLGSGDGPPAREPTRQAGDAPTREVKPGHLHLAILARGWVGPDRPADLYCRVEGSRKILQVLPDGSAVKKGDVICTLDPANLHDRLAGQETAIKNAEAAHQRAKKAREDAEKALKTHRQSLAKAEQDGQKVDTRDWTTREHELEVMKARSDELARQTTWDLEKSKLAKLVSEIRSCTITAPRDGQIVLANNPAPILDDGPTIRQGATVRGRQKIASVYDPNGAMQIIAKVPESEVGAVAPSMPARVVVDAFPNVTMPGVVLEVAPLPDPMNVLDRDIKVYTTRIRIAKPAVQLVPGMTARVQIDAVDLENVLSVPRGAIVRYQKRDHLAIKGADGKVAWRDVVLGGTDGSNVEVKEGLKSGEKVIVDPRPFLTGEQKAILEAEHKAALQKDAERQANLRKAIELRKARGKTPRDR